MSTQYIGAGTHLANVTVTAFRLLSLSTNGGVTYTAANGKPAGVSLTDCASGDYVGVKYIHNSGTQKVESAGSAIAVGDTLYSGALGTVSGAGSTAVGIAMSAAPAASSTGTIIEFLPNTL